MEEVWKDIEGYEGYYQISNLGRVRSLDRFVYDEHNDKIQFKKGQLMKNCYNKRLNMYEIHLHKNNKRKCLKIHRLVAYAFINNLLLGLLFVMLHN